MGPPVHYPPPVHDEDLVRLHDGRQPVGDDDGGMPMMPLLQGGENRTLCPGVDRTKGIVENQNCGIPKQCPGDGETLPLPA